MKLSRKKNFSLIFSKNPFLSKMFYQKNIKLVYQEMHCIFCIVWKNVGWNKKWSPWLKFMPKLFIKKAWSVNLRYI